MLANTAIRNGAGFCAIINEIRPECLAKVLTDGRAQEIGRRCRNGTLRELACAGDPYPVDVGQEHGHGVCRRSVSCRRGPGTWAWCVQEICIL